MPFGTITSNSLNYEPRAEGIYSLSTLSFADPRNEFRIRGASPRKDGILSGSVTRVLQKDVTFSGDTVRRSANVSLQIQVPNGPDFTAAEIDALAADISTFLTTTSISRLLVGES